MESSRKRDTRTALEIRTELLQVASELLEELRKIAIPINTIIARLSTEADKHLKAAVEESLGPSFNRRRQKFVYKTTQPGNPISNAPAEETKKGKRKCRICNTYGHNARTCPNKK